MKDVILYTDGACSGNPGPGGYGAILDFQGKRRELSAGFQSTTNNRMELLAVIAGLSALNEPCVVQVVSDSKYVVDAIEKGWLLNWQKNGWHKSDKKPVLNVDLWQQLIPLLSRHTVTFRWIKGHTGHPENERCDILAVTASLQQKENPNASFSITPTP